MKDFAAYDNSPRTDRTVRPAEGTPAAAALARKLPKTLSLGTVGWYHPSWRGTVYDRFTGDRPDWFQTYAAYAAHPLFRATEWVLSRRRRADERDWQRIALLTPADFSLLIRLSGRVTDPVLRQRRGEAAGENPDFLSIELVREIATEPIARHFGANPPGVLLDILADPRKGAYRPAGRKAFYERLEVFLARWREETEAPLYVNVRTPLLQTPALMKLLLKSGAQTTLTLTSGGASLSAQLRSLAWYDEAAGESAARSPLILRWLAPQVPTHFRGERAGLDPVTTTRLAYAAASALSAGRRVLFLADEKAEGDAPGTVMRFAESAAERLRRMREESERAKRNAPPDLPPLQPSQK